MIKWSWFMMLNATFQLYRGGQFYWWKKPEYSEKATDLSQVTDKLHNIIDKIKNSTSTFTKYWPSSTCWRLCQMFVLHMTIEKKSFTLLTCFINKYLIEETTALTISTQSCLSLHSIQSLSTPKNQEYCQNPFIKG